MRELALAPSPPLRLLWKSGVSVVTAVSGDSGVYGLTQDGYLAAFEATSGTLRWITSQRFLSNRLAVAENAVYVFQPNVGLVEVQDQGTTYAVRTLYAMSTLDETTAISHPVRLADKIHFVHNGRLKAVPAGGGNELFSVGLNAEGPHALFNVDASLIVVSGAGKPSRWNVEANQYRLAWDTGLTGAVDLTERTLLVASTYAYVTGPAGVAAYDVRTGASLWARSGIGNLALALEGSFLYVAGDQAGLWCLDTTSGSTVWERQYLAFVNHTPHVGLAVSQEYLWVGAELSDGYEPTALWAVNRSNGNFAWQATGIALSYGNGLPLLVGNSLLTYGAGSALAAMASLPSVPAIKEGDITQAPGLLQGAMNSFPRVEITLKLPVAAKVSFLSWHERDDKSMPFGPIDYPAGKATITYNPKWPWGWTDINQFGRLTLELEEAQSGLKYNHVLLVPVNTLPDIQHHWAKRSIETMLYLKYINGYPDLTFLPDNRITRAETSTIIGKTLGLTAPSPGFQTKFTDLTGHWARNYILALEERNIVGGFLEPDGTYTFRPSVPITRAQEARILVKAYEVPAASPSFQTRFTDVEGHWAKPDILALEAQGHVTGFREPDGTYTYRPEQNLTRAELCTMVVRIRHLTRADA